MFNSFTVYRDEHLSHHKHIGDYENDLDLQGIKNLGLHDPLTTPVVLRHIATPLVLRHLPYYLSLNLSRNDGFGCSRWLQYAMIGCGFDPDGAGPLDRAIDADRALCVYLFGPHVLGGLHGSCGPGAYG